MNSELTVVVVVFVGALLAGWTARALKAPSIVGFLVAGIAIGPLGLFEIHAEDIEFFAELGLVLLLFTIGLELSPELLLRLGWRLLLAAVLQVGATGLLAAAVLAPALGLPAGAVTVVGIAVALSSTAIVLKQLSERGEAGSAAGTLITGILLIQDIGVILVMIFLPLFAATDASVVELLGRSALAIGGLVAGTAVAALIVPRVVNFAFRRSAPELMTLCAVSMAVAGAWLADLANWSWPLGACIAGLVLGQTDLRHQLRAEITPFRDAFNALFFISIGMLVDLDVVREHALWVALGVVLTLAIKTLLTTAAITIAGWPVRLGLMAGLGLCTISEFGYVLAREGERLGLLATSTLSLLVAWTVGTMLLGAALVPISGPLASALTRRLFGEGRAADERAGPGGHEIELTSHVIIVGYGVNGQNLARALRATRIPYLVIEMNRATAAPAREQEAPLIIGDATRSAILERAGLRTARALVVAIAEQRATRDIVAQARHVRPDLYILARTRYVSELDSLYRLGARQVIPEEFETSIEIFAHVLKEFGVPDNVIEQQVLLARAGRYGMLRDLPADRQARADWLRVLELSVTQTVLVFEGSPACGRTIRQLDLRARTGVTIVAITRSGKPTANPAPEFEIQAQDVLVLVGTHRQLDEAKALLDPGGDDEGASMEGRAPA